MKERDELIAALSDVYGPVSAPLKNLIDIALLKSLAGEYDVEKIVATKKGAAFVFRDANVFKEQNLLSAVAKLTEDVVLTATVPPQLLFNTKGMTVEQVVEKMINFLLITQKS